MCSPPLDSERLQSLGVTASRLLGAKVVSLVSIGGGRNSRVFRLEDTQARRFALKCYFRHGTDRRDRLATEFSALDYMRRNGIQEVPRPIAFDSLEGCAIYEFINGERVAETFASLKDIGTIVTFLGELRELSLRGESGQFGPASEACFSGLSLEKNVRMRRERLAGREGNPAITAALDSFLDRELAPVMERVLIWSRQRFEARGWGWKDDLDAQARTFSPSDFGFHNILRGANGRLVFLDFEYFGWDDPAKMICDFLLHPAMNLSLEQKRTFVAGVLRRFAGQDQLAGRVEAFYPLFGLKWCFILLNEFLPPELERRQFAGSAELDRDALQMKQLMKAKQMLNRICNEYERFPYVG